MVRCGVLGDSAVCQWRGSAFIESNVYDLGDNLGGKFDIVFASYGVTAWLPDIFEWARVAAHFLKPRGTFYIVEFHPIMVMLDDSGKEFAYPYFNPGEPFREVVRGSYASSAEFEHETCEWNHPLGDIVTALVEAGMEIEFLHEFPWSIGGGFKYLELENPDVPGRYVFKDRSVGLPLMFSIKATRK